MGLHRSTLTGFYHLCRAVLRARARRTTTALTRCFWSFSRTCPWPRSCCRRADGLARPPENGLEELQRLSATSRAIAEEEHGRDSQDVGRAPPGADRGAQRRHVLDRHRAATPPSATPASSPQRHPGRRREPATAAPIGWRESGSTGTSARTTPSTPASSRWPSACCGSFPPDQPSDKTELDVDGTIRDTCDNAGTLKVRYKRPADATPSRCCC